METVADESEKLVTAATWLGFGAMCLGMFMAILDVQIVATSLPTIQGALGIAPDQMSWVQTAYLIAEVIAIPLTGFLLRVLSMRWLFVASVAVFTVASVGCAASGQFPVLIAWRVLQGFSGGTLIPAVFAAVFLLFPQRRQALATTIAGVMAVSAPTAGPIAGGWITSTFSWHWLFLINVLPGILAILVAAGTLPRSPLHLREARALDYLSLVLMAIGLAALVIALKQAPERGWTSGLVIGLIALSVASSAGFVRRTLQATAPIVDLRTFADRRFAVGCILSFVLGIGLFGSVYLMPVFLAFVRGHDALEIGKVMLVTGVAQLLIAPVAVALEQRANARLLTAAGFVLFSLGLGMSAFQTPETDFAGMFWPQVVRGLAIMFCLLPPTRLALGHLDAGRVPDASGVFNLMRNLGGAIGLALIDTVIYTRAPQQGESILARLEAGDTAAARFVGIPLELFANRPPGPVDAATLGFLRPLVEKAAMVEAINDAWTLLAGLTIAAVLCLPFAKNLDDVGMNLKRLARPPVDRQPRQSQNGQPREGADPETAMDDDRDESLNVLGEPLKPCSFDPMTGFFRDGCCNTGPSDRGRHTVCVRLTAEFLTFSRARGNDLSTPRPEYGFPGLRPGDRWCLCAARWTEALEAGKAPQVVLASTHISMLRHVPLEVLKAHALPGRAAPTTH